MYGSRSNANPLSRATTTIAVLFMVTSISLAWYSSASVQEGSGMKEALLKEQKIINAKEIKFEVDKLPYITPQALVNTPEKNGENTGGLENVNEAEIQKKLKEIIDSQNSNMNNESENKKNDNAVNNALQSNGLPNNTTTINDPNKTSEKSENKVENTITSDDKNVPVSPAEDKKK